MGAWSAGSTRRWRRIRRFVLERDGYRCRCHRDGWCAAPGVPAHRCLTVANHAHHTLGRRLTGDDPAYIVAACRSCNLAIGEPKQADPPGKGATKW